VAWGISLSPWNLAFPINGITSVICLLWDLLAEDKEPKCIKIVSFVLNVLPIYCSTYLYVCLCVHTTHIMIFYFSAYAVCMHFFNFVVVLIDKYS